MKMNKDSILILLVGICLFFVGCKNPTGQFKTFVETADTKLKNDVGFQNEYEYESLEFDIKETNSTISPFAAIVIISAKAKNCIEFNRFERVEMGLYDWGDRRFIFTYAYQDNAWKLTDYELTTGNRTDRNILVTHFATHVPSKIKEYFTPNP